MIKIQIDEYENLLNETNLLHQESMELINDYVENIEGLLIPGGGFHADLISEKVKLIVEIFKEKLIPELEASFEETERELSLMGERLVEGDESGRLNVQWEK